MLGNDLVDLRDPEARPEAQHPRFDERVFADSELTQLAGSEDPHRLRWTLWAAKESAFKWLRKQNASAIFTPCRFVVDVQSGCVRGADFALDLEFEQGEDFVHAVALSAPGAAWIVGVDELHGANTPQAASLAARRLAIQGVAKLLGVSPSELSFARVGKIPRMYWRDQLAEVDLSLSHHGRFVAYAASPRTTSALARGAA